MIKKCFKNELNSQFRARSGPIRLDPAIRSDPVNTWTDFSTSKIWTARNKYLSLFIKTLRCLEWLLPLCFLQLLPLYLAFFFFINMIEVSTLITRIIREFMPVNMF